ncbi:hypothetical protein [Mycobacterium sp. URHB0021]
MGVEILQRMRQAAERGARADGPFSSSLPLGPMGTAPPVTMGRKKFHASCVLAQISAGFFALSI